MMFWMNSRTFQNTFLTNEKDHDILKAQYVMVSTRIRVRSPKKNIISGHSLLFPDAHVCSALVNDDFKSRYYDQLEKSKPFIASLIKASIEENYNIIFLCTKNESKLKYLQYLADYTYLEFGYPIYEYERYSSGELPLRKYDKKEVIDFCNKILKNAKNKQFINDMETEDGRKRIIKDFNKMSKKTLKENLVKRNLYEKGMSKKDMIETMEIFL